MSPPLEGTFEHHGNATRFAMTGWYVPALIASDTKWGNHRGMRLGYVLWMSITAWPFVFIVSISRMCINWIFRAALAINKFGTSITHFLAHSTLSPEELEEPSKTLELIEAEREVEEICK